MGAVEKDPFPDVLLILRMYRLYIMSITQVTRRGGTTYNSIVSPGHSFTET